MKNPKQDPKKLAKPTVAAHLAKYSLNQIRDLFEVYVGQQRIMIAEHLLQTFVDIAEYYETKSNGVYDSYRQREEALIKKMGKASKPLVAKSFYKLFDFETVLTETDYYTAEEFNALEDQANQLTLADILHWTHAIKNFLYGALRDIYLEQEPFLDGHANEDINASNEAGDKEMTEARRLLAIYFILKAGFNIEQKVTHSATAIAHLCHFLLGKGFTTAQNSSIYAKYKKMPEYNSGNVLVKDLRYIRQFFEELELKPVLELIDWQIESTLKDKK
jgi:hypothetical protein